MSIPLSDLTPRSSEASAPEGLRPWTTPALAPLDILNETGTGLTETFSEKVVFVTPLGPTTS